MNNRFLFIAFTSILLVGIASAQSFNVDLYGNSPATIPSSSFGAAAAQPGVWNSTSCVPCPTQTIPLVDLAGQPTSVTLTLIDTFSTSDVCTDPGLTADEAALLKSGRAILPVGEPTFIVQGLQAGNYDLYFYVGPKCGELPASSVFTVSVEEVGALAQLQLLSGASPAGPFEFRGNYAHVRFALESSQPLYVGAYAGGPQVNSFDIHGLQLVSLPGPIVPVCFASNEAAPCCTLGQFGRGCPSSFQPLGARLDGVGSTSIANDALVLNASEVGSGAVLFFQGIDHLAVPVRFGDGISCTGTQGRVRIGTKQPSGGSTSYPQAGDVPISVRGLVPATGGTRIYQGMYRNVVPFCGPAGFNLTNGVLVTWSP